MVDFAGWSMPVQYGSIVAEHIATRGAVGLFDVSHMGRFGIRGPDAPALLERVLSRRTSDMRAGQIRYSLVTNESGGILDDVLIYCLAEAGAPPDYLLVVNASNRQKIWDWLAAHAEPHQVELVDQTLDTAMIAVQGPRALEIARPLVAIDVARLRYYHGARCQISGGQGIASRTGYTGEDGCELIVSREAALAVWEKLVSAAAQFSGSAAGLGARDTLRLEAAMPLYGHELNETRNPLQAGLEFAVDLEGRSFPGRDALVKLSADKSQPRRVGWELAGRRVPREGYEVYDGQRRIGQVTSGTFSPTLDRPIAMGYVAPQFATVGTSALIDIRGNREPARVAPLPFYKRPK